MELVIAFLGGMLAMFGCMASIILFITVKSCIAVCKFHSQDLERIQEDKSAFKGKKGN